MVRQALPRVALLGLPAQEYLVRATVVARAQLLIPAAMVVAVAAVNLLLAQTVQTGLAATVVLAALHLFPDHRRSTDRAAEAGLVAARLELEERMRAMDQLLA